MAYEEMAGSSPLVAVGHGKPLPDVTAPLTAPFWQGLRDRRLLVQKCAECDALRFPVEVRCPECLADGGIWIEIDAHGVLWSYIVYHRALSAAFADVVPYAVGVVELEQRLQILSGLDVPLDQIRVGDRMQARFVDVTPTITLLRWGHEQQS